MENFCILTDFDINNYTGKFETVKSAAEDQSYSVYTGANCIYICNTTQTTARFSFWKKSTIEISDEQIINWINEIKKRYPKF